MASSFLLILLCAIRLTLQLESDLFLIYNENHKKCLQADKSIIGVADCMKDNNAQKFRWISKHQLINAAVAQCLGVSSKSEMSSVKLSACDGIDELQRWECKNDTLFGIQGQDFYLNYGNAQTKVVIHKTSGDWSRWKIYGTSDDLCVKAYEEIYTIKGNGNGQPCVFPFKYKSKWYADCTIMGRKDVDLACSTTANYDKDQLLGYCPIITSRKDWWFTDPHSGSQYQINGEAALTWYQARKSCQQQAAELLSIPELHEQTYISGLTSNVKTALWIGLDSLDLNAGWMWNDGSPFRYLNWLPGNPSADHGKNCVSLDPEKNSKWENKECSQKLGYICKKGNTTSYVPPPDTESIRCPPTWISYAGFCYYLYKEAKMWQDARVACRKEEGDLASLHNLEEASFANSNFEFEDIEHVWLGLNDLKKQMFFEWSDDSEMTYTVWQRGEPSQTDNRNEDCVALNTKVGKWSDQLCEKKFPYICKRKPLPSDHEIVPIPDPGCNMGWKRHGLYCYFVGEVVSSFSEANSTCNMNAAFLVTINDRFEQAYLTSLIGLRPEKHFWTGLSNMEERETFKWTTRDRVLYTHWNADMPGRKQGCVVMKTGNKGGLWDVINCDEKAKFVCKTLAQGVTPPPIPKTTAEPKCPTGWRTSHQISSCFKYYSGPEKKTWTEARDFCRAIGGDLISINNRLEQDVLLSMRPDFKVRGSQKIWIGLISSDPDEGFQWSDGSPLIYENWDFGEPNSHQQLELCGEFYPNYRLQWNDAHCDHPNNWICELQKGAELLPEPTSLPYPESNLTSDGWLIRDDKQYYVSDDAIEGVDRARDFCRRNYGDLVSISGEEERLFLWRFILRNRTRSSYYIGLQLSLDKQFKWMDGSPVDYVVWAVNEPSFSNHEENCVVLERFHGRWNDINCGTPSSYICERKTENINTTFAPTVPAPQGGCPSGWTAFGRKCYRIFGSVQEEEEDHLVDWDAARSACKFLGANLASIRNSLEQDFFTYQLRDFKNPLWIGLNDINLNRKYMWTDQSSVTYTNWAKGHPSIGFYYSDEGDKKDCVVMKVGDKKDDGSWIEQDCQLNKGYICQKFKDPALPIVTTATPTLDQYKFGDDKYKFQKTKMKWDEALQMCKQLDYDLASILDIYTASFLRVQLDTFKEPFWIGLYSNNKTNNQYKWIDGWRLNYTKWASGEPKETNNCVYIDVDGHWKTSSCDENYASVCKQNSARPPTEEPQKPGKCPESSSTSWIPFRDYCYLFEVSALTFWAQAFTDCVHRGGHLVSIEDQREAEFISQHVELFSDKINSFWIGLYRNVEGKWLWLDNTLMDYVNWGDDPDKLPTRTCITMDSKKGTWHEGYCHFNKGYICKARKIPVPPDNTTTPGSSEREQQKITHGVAVGVSILVIAVIATIVAVVYFKHKKKLNKAPPAQESFDNTLYFSSNNSAANQDTNVLVDAMEQS